MAELVVRRDCLQTQYFLEPLSSDSQLEMISIPGGSLMMGSPEDEEERLSTEGPQHSVDISPFFLARYPITEAQWQAGLEIPEQNRPLELPSNLNGETYPITDVSWLDAVEFCDRLAYKTGCPYRLPTEAEWEYACRAGTTTPFHFGETISPELANYDSEYSYNGSPTQESVGATTPVGNYDSANHWGLSDMHGNIWEWCQDNWHDNYEGAPNDGSAWGNQNDSNHVCRGGSWNTDPWSCRSASRLNDLIFNYVGFRVACSAPRT